MKSQFYRSLANMGSRPHWVWLLGGALLWTAPCLSQTTWPTALAAQKFISLNGNGIYTDSYDSQNPAKSNQGRYDPSVFSGDDGDILVNGGIANYGSSASIRYAHVFGKIHIGPNCSVSMDSDGGVGPHCCQASDVATAIQKAYITRDASITFPDATPPPAADFWLSSGGGTVVINQATNSYRHIFFANQKYREVTLIDGPSLVLGTNISLYLPNGLTGNESIVYAQPGTVLVNSDNVWTEVNVPQVPTLLVYAGGTSFHTGYDINANGYPASFIVYCATSVTSVTMQGVFSGVLVAPDADVTWVGGGNNPYGSCGAVMARSITGYGHAAFHFDESLSRIGFGPPWTTAQPQSQAVVVGQSASFSVTANGGGPLSYQWQLNGVALLDATNSALTLTNVSLSDAGVYSVVITNLYASTSAAANLSVFATPAPTLGTPVWSGATQVQFEISGVPDFRYVVEASTNLIDWIPLGTNYGPSSFVDREALNFPQRYYRSVWMP